jgi:pimeloyl-ACP methyl ester carboxylesterase
MPKAVLDDGVGIEYDDFGSGIPIVWCHEFSGDKDSWLPQVHYFARSHRVITFNARGYPPSDVPAGLAAYSQERAADDVAGLLRHLGIDTAYVGGLSMGGETTLQFGLSHPEMARGLIIGAAGAGTFTQEATLKGILARADQTEAHPEKLAELYGNSPGRAPLRRKDPLAAATFEAALAGHSAEGAVKVLRGIIARRPVVFEIPERLRAMDVPSLILVGDEDDPCIESSVFMKRHIPRSGLVMFPQSGHSLNLEDPALFNQTVLSFINEVEAGRWPRRAATKIFQGRVVADSGATR